MKITSPVKGYSETTEIGPYRFEFKDGVVDYDEAAHGKLNEGVKAYLKEQGYGIGATRVERPEPAPEPLDPRSDAADEQVGTKTRDGAVDPAEGDFLGPTNAGEANPHGSKVVNPEIHASQGVRPIKGGDVHVSDPAAQDAAEKAHTVAATDAEKADQPDPVGTEAENLKGQALDDALTGTADEKRQRLAEHQAQA